MSGGGARTGGSQPSVTLSPCNHPMGLFGSSGVVKCAESKSASLGIGNWVNLSVEGLSRSTGNRSVRRGLRGEDWALRTVFELDIPVAMSTCLIQTLCRRLVRNWNLLVDYLAIAWPLDVLHGLACHHQAVEYEPEIWLVDAFRTGQ